MTDNSLMRTVKNLFIGRERDLAERGLFHKLSLVALLAWVGLGADGLSSSCYGPEEAYKVLLAHPSLALFVAIMTTATVVIICASYSQIIALFPAGGGGYVVASRLLSPTAGVVSGSALLIDYVLTISISVASGMDALFSFLPESWLAWKLAAAVAGILFLTVLNLRGVRESVLLLVPVFSLFLLTHTFAVLYAFGTHAGALAALPGDTVKAVHGASAEIGVFGVIALLLRAYSMGAGTYTGIEAVSNGLPILREPRVRTGRRTMVLMAISLGGMVAGLLVAYLLLGVHPVAGKTLNAVLLEQLAAGWPAWLGGTFVKVALTSAAALLLIAAQAGFLDGPRVLANMALDRWMPSRFTALSDRFVTLNGVLIMGAAALLVLLLTRGAVDLLVVLYSINVFITFSLSQLGMVRHWWQVRHAEAAWWRRLAINAVGLALTSFILVTLVVLKFHDGGWVTLLMTTALVALAFAVRRHYESVRKQLTNLDSIVEVAELPPPPGSKDFAPASNRTAVVLVNGFNGLGLHTLLGAVRLFGGGFRRMVFVQIGVLDAGNFKGTDEIERLRGHVQREGERYVRFVQTRGGEAEAVTAVGHEVLDELGKLVPNLVARHANVVFFTGQLVFERETVFTRLLHNYTAFALQRRLFLRGLPCAIVPIRVLEPVA
ncbi:MAG: APC family permease [Opitutaceae bacterium]|nr:APC family permease [Opitutaceae bacterium]